MICDNCYCTEIPDCLDILGIVFDAQDIDVIITIEDKFKRKIKFTSHIDSSGLAIIDLDEADQELLNPYAGQFILTAEDVLENEVGFTDGTTDYNCIRFSVVKTFPKQTGYYIDPENLINPY
jgi:hypothetical protein